MCKHNTFGIAGGSRGIAKSENIFLGDLSVGKNFPFTARNNILESNHFKIKFFKLMGWEIKRKYFFDDILF